MTFRPVYQQEIVQQPIETVSKTPKQDLGSRYKVRDDVTGAVAEVAYVKFGASGSDGKLMAYSPSSHIAFSLSSSVAGHVGIALNNASSNDYGWLLIYGSYPANAIAAAVGDEVYTSGTAGAVSNVNTGTIVTDARFSSTVTDGKAQLDLNYPEVA